MFNAEIDAYLCGLKKTHNIVPTLLSNRSQAFIMMEDWPNGFADVAASLTIRPDSKTKRFKSTKGFCYNPSKFEVFCGENEFKFQVDVTTDEWPHETFWDLTHEDRTIMNYACNW